MSERWYQFPGSDSSLQENIDHLKKRAEALNELASKLEGAYQQSAITELTALYSSFAGCMALLAEQLPFKDGDRVRLVVAPECTGGWAPSKHFLVVGAVGTIKSVSIDYLMRDWSVNVEFDDESWIPSSDYVTSGHKKGVAVPVAPENRHVYGFSPRYVEKIETPKHWSMRTHKDWSL